MCGPALPIMAIAGAVLSAGGQVYSGMAAQAQGKYEQQVADQNAAMERKASTDASNRGLVDQRNQYRKIAQEIGAQRAAQAASGLDTGFGSAVGMTNDTAKIGYEDVATIAENTRREQQGFDINAANYTMQGRAARARGNAAMVSGVIGAAGSLLSSASQIGKIGK
jgi:hypothetical protein